GEEDIAQVVGESGGGSAHTERAGEELDDARKVRLRGGADGEGLHGASPDPGLSSLAATKSAILPTEARSLISICSRGTRTPKVFSSVKTSSTNINESRSPSSTRFTSGPGGSMLSFSAKTA